MPTATTIPPAVIGSGATKISLWDGLTGSDGSTFDAMLTQYVKENPDVTITDEEIGWGSLYPKLTSAFVAGNPPDMFVLHAAEIPQFASQGTLMATDDMFDTKGGPLPSKDFADPAYNLTVYNGVRYGVLLDNHGYGTWVNNALLKKAGMDPTQAPPVGYDKVVAWLQKLTIDKNGKNAADPAFDPNNVVQWGYAQEWQHYLYQSIMFQYGGSVISPDGKKATINSPANVQALQAIVDLIYKYHVMPPPAGFNSWGAYSGGTLAVINSGGWFLNNAKSTQPDNYTAYPMLQFGPNPGTMFGAHVMLMPATLSADKVTAVKKLQVWMSNHDALWAASGQTPARISIRDSLDPKQYVTNVIIGQQFPKYGHMEVQSPVGLDIVNAEDPNLDTALAGQKTPQEALDAAAKQIQQILDHQ
jgi:ABC-type glycerol-3-phosphate transport system substrate-binding protein